MIRLKNTLIYLGDIMLNLLFDTKKVCLFCLNNKEDLERFICPICGGNIESNHKETNINSIYLDNCYYSVYYNRFIKNVLHNFKFNDKSYLYKPLGELLIQTIKGYSMEDEIDLIYYIPMHRRKKAKRGYNQSELLASYVSEKLSLPISHNLKKIKSTKEQHRLNKTQRQTNLKDSFKLKNGKEVEDKTILLIDDLITTGATLDECAKVLKENNPKKIIGLCLASPKE